MAELFNEHEIILLFREESTKQKAFVKILDFYQKRVYWHVRRILVNHDDADDVTQNTFIKVWENLQNFRQDSKLYTWIFRIATNEALSFLNKKRSSTTSSLQEYETILNESLIAGSYFDGNAIELKLQQALLLLPDKQKLVFNMKYYENMKYEEIEQILGTSVGALKASYHHAVKKIEEYLKCN
ncbi:MAG: RNA polymerase sigma factor [Bacteroidetes bacterium]|nr:RNA polymerase sigma factor [Bacteroidota bacterium]